MVSGIGAALIELADIANCVSGDFHTLHLNMQGAEFDTLHKKILKTYYEAAADDYDTWSEAALMFEPDAVPSTNESAKRIEWQSEGNTVIDRTAAVDRTNIILNEYLEKAVALFNVLEPNKKNAGAIGVANTLQTRIEYWSKELLYFNARRS